MIKATPPRIISTLLAAGLMAVSALTAADKPNVLFIITDDQGLSDFGFTGNKLVKTPRIDRLAAQSAVFENFVVNPACSPSRGSFYTGRQHLSVGIWGVPPRANLQRDEALMPAFFRKAGYHTFYAGKSDTARLPESSPWERGWDQGYFVSGYQHRDPILPNRDGTFKPKGWTVDILTTLILDFWKQHPKEPWLATAAYVIPHLPWVCDESFSAPFEKQGLSKDLALCYGSIAQMDAAIGRLLDALHDSGQEENTIVVLVSDNGMSQKNNDKKELAADDWTKRNLHQLRGHKATVWENGIRVPCLVRWPGRIKPGSRAQFGGAEDILPTMLDLAGISHESVPHLPFDGSSLRRVLDSADATFERPDLFRIAISGPGSPRDLPAGKPRRYEDHHLALRGPQYKFHALPGGTSELYDLKADPRETTDVKDQHPDVAQRMSAECRKRWDDIMASGRAFLPPPAGGSTKKEK